MAEILYAVSVTDNTGSWTDEAGGTTNLHTACNDSDEDKYLKSVISPSTAPITFKLDAPSGTPGTGTWTVGFAVLKLPNSTAPQIDGVVQIREGYTNEGSPGTLIATLTKTNVAAAGGLIFSTFTHDFSAGEVAAITDPTDLYARLTANAP